MAYEKQILADFSLSQVQLLKITTDFQNKILMGLSKDRAEIKCLPVFISPLDNSPLQGTAYVLDLGGSNLRAAVISVVENNIEFLTPIKTIEIPWQRNVAFPRKDFLAMQADLLASLDYPHPCPLGYCFSYPTTSLINGDAALIRWTKDIHVPKTLGKDIGALLLEYIKNHYPKIRITSVSVINDTVASLFAGLSEEKKDASIGLIVGTGTNMATNVDSDKIPKLLTTNKKIPVNLESGNFTPPYLNKWDHILDDLSENKHAQRLEKAVSGMYLGRLFKAAYPESAFDSDSGAQGLVKMLNNPSRVSAPYIELAEKIYTRSANLVASQLAGLICLLAEQSFVDSINIVAEGGLFWSEVSGQKRYYHTVRDTLDELIKTIALPKVSIEFKKIENANLVGSALAALSNSQ